MQRRVWCPGRRGAGLLVVAVLLAAHGGVAALAAEQRARVGRQPDGSVLSPQGQLLTPAGRSVTFRGRPTAVAVRPDGATAAVLVADGDLQVVDLGAGMVKQAVTGHGASVDGIAYSPDGGTLYTSNGGDEVGVSLVAPDGTLGARTPIKLGGNPFTTGLALSPDGARLYVALSREDALAVIDVASRTVVRRIDVGKAPHSVVAGPDGRVYVSNEGGRRPVAGDTTGISAGRAVVADPFTAATTSGTVSVVDPATGAAQTVAVGLHPTALALDAGRLFVANTNGDSVSVLDTAAASGPAVVDTVAITPFPRAPVGSQPTGVRVVGDRLFVSLGNSNAVASYSVPTPAAAARFQGLLPTAGYPAAVAVDPVRGALVVPDLRGLGSVGDADSGNPARGVSSEVGVVSLLPLPTDAELQQGAERVAVNNGWNRIDTACAAAGVAPRAVPLHVGEPSPIQHVVYLIKENRTYDQVMGDIGKGDSDPSLTQFGRTFTPNQHALAETFGLFDNYYSSGRRSNDGHNWGVQANSPDYLEKDPGTRRVTSEAPSKGTPPSSGFDSLLYTPGGFLWENVLRSGGTFQDFGEYTRENATPPADTDIPSLKPHVVTDYPGYNLNFLDVDRAAIFKRELAKHEQAKDLPTLTLMTLSNDHTGGGAPPFNNPGSQVADNDRATGEIVDALSHSSFWGSTAVFITEDDSQGGTDHVDGHRTPFFLASPYARRGVIDPTNYNQINIVRTIEQILGLPAMNQFDVAAEPMRSAFTDTPDLTPFTASPALVPFRPNPPLSAQTGLRREWNTAVADQDLRHLDRADEQLLNRDVWYEMRGYDAPYPGDARVLRPWEVPTSLRGQGVDAQVQESEAGREADVDGPAVRPLLRRSAQAACGTSASPGPSGGSSPAGPSPAASSPAASSPAASSPAASSPAGPSPAGPSPAGSSPASPRPTATASAAGSVAPSAAGTASAGPTASPTPPASPAGSACRPPLRLSVDRAVTVPGRPVRVRVSGTPGAAVTLQAYSRPATTYRTVRRLSLDGTGSATTEIRPGTNTRLFAACDGVTSASRAVSVQTVVSLAARRTDGGRMLASGRVLPRVGGQLVSLYRVRDGGAVLSGRVRTDPAGRWRLVRTLSGGPLLLQARAATTPRNAAGTSAVVRVPR